jgi:hypothetical protein
MRSAENSSGRPVKRSFAASSRGDARRGRRGTIDIGKGFLKRLMPSRLGV